MTAITKFWLKRLFCGVPFALVCVAIGHELLTLTGDLVNYAYWLVDFDYAHPQAAIAVPVDLSAIWILAVVLMGLYLVMGEAD